MTLSQTLQQRAEQKCELCTGTTGLDVMAVSPYERLTEDTAALICAECRSQIEHAQPLDAKHWYSLNESIWSEHLPVKVLAYRVLKDFGANPWAQDLLGQIYFDDDTQKWADAGVVSAAPAGDEGSLRVFGSNGAELTTGDTVTLIKDLEVKGANFTAKRGTTVKNIALTDDPKYVEGKVNGMRIVLVAAYLKKS